jgi:hypothetical protein
MKPAVVGVGVVVVVVVIMSRDSKAALKIPHERKVKVLPQHSLN